MINKKVGLISGAVGVVALAAIGATFATGDEPVEQSQRVANVDSPAITVYRNENCGCCKSWAEHLEKNGFQVDLVVTTNMNDVKKKYGVPREMQSCHTAVMDDVVIEGHVPADDINAYLEKPVFNTKGLAVPGMVQGSPGMETGRKDDYSVIAFSENGKTSVFREHKDY
jgi:hypothetical protein